MHSILGYLAIGCLAVLPIYTASHSSLRRPSTAPAATEEEDDEETQETIDSSHALLFPIIAGSMLGLLYLIITYISKEWLNFLFSAYFSMIGIASNFNALHSSLDHFLPGYLKQFTKHKYAIKKRVTADEDWISLECTAADIFLGVVCTVFSVQLFRTNHWLLANLFGLAFCFNVLQLVVLDSFQTGMLLLSALFFYDVYFVFGTKIMVTVAKGVEAPIKLLWPKDPWYDPKGPAMMLGLGDIVLPGIYIALCLRYDLHEYHRQHPGQPYKKKWFDFPKQYFRASMISYILGLSLTIICLHLFKAAQPALLYLSPSCILSTIIRAWYAGELHRVWAYHDAGEQKGDTEKKAS